MKWIFFVARRFSRVDKKTRSSAAGNLSMLGICFGVVTLIVTLSVMNGFQRTYIDCIMEAGSAHLRCTIDDNQDNQRDITELEAALTGFSSNGIKRIKTFYPFYEAQTLMSGTGDNADSQSPALIRSLPSDICALDTGFANEIKITQGAFDIGGGESIILGINLANKLGVETGDKVNLFALSGSSAIDMISSNRIFTVTGIFHSSYSEINSTYVFISLEAGKRIFSDESVPLYAVKLFEPNLAESVKTELSKKLPQVQFESWQEFNRAFFGALRVEKNTLMFLVFIIFWVVAVNIYNSMCRMVFERRSEIAVFSALGAKKNDIQTVFVARGFLTGFTGTALGLVLALLICVQMKNIFMAVSYLQYFAEYFAAMLINPEYAAFVHPNQMFWVYASIPARIYFNETAFTCLFGVLASTVSAFFASLNILNLSVAEVLHDE